MEILIWFMHLKIYLFHLWFNKYTIDCTNEKYLTAGVCILEIKERSLLYIHYERVGSRRKFFYDFLFIKGAK